MLILLFKALLRLRDFRGSSTRKHETDRKEGEERKATGERVICQLALRNFYLPFTRSVVPSMSCQPVKLEKIHQEYKFHYFGTLTPPVTNLDSNDSNQAIYQTLTIKPQLQDLAAESRVPRILINK